ncbi:3-oxoacyl-(acyl-carrier protein) reductase [Mesorhizobium plurifarium]|uniref:3-oxoacyl-(Acyl-carrier protein) reductase n=1 Tax=Mesorhizobium plurifarium TaxID=69974 RepID=A0A090DEE3_MESPL|nr:3-oxoacyl-(acyl-carrier protein) reductase [Mesorhizobium plurifarium]
MDLGLKGRNALVLGASKGLGRAVAKELLDEGARVAICARTAAALEQTAREIGATALVCDLAKPGAATELVERAKATLGTPDIVVVNTGGPPTAPFDEITIEQWRAAFDNLFMSAVEIVRAVLPSMREKKWGRVLFVTSIAAKEPINRFALSNSLRAGIHGLINTLSKEEGANGITFNALMPGYTLTERLADAKLDLEKVSQAIPARRIGRPEEFAALAAFLASDRASYITGQAVACDGGALWSI